VLVRSNRRDAIDGSPPIRWDTWEKDENSDERC
jgi:hypothetical protein